MSDRKKFGCTGCGICCQNIRSVFENAPNLPEEYQQGLREFPYAVKQDGSCEKLGEDKRCTVYATRPLICNVERMYYKAAKGKNVSKKDYYNKEASWCNMHIMDKGLDKKFLVPLIK